jgi:hypothetical protein
VAVCHGDRVGLDHRRGVDAIKAAEAKAATAARDVYGTTMAELRRLQTGLSELEGIVGRDRSTRKAERRELTRHRIRVPVLEELIAKPDAAARLVKADAEGKVLPGSVDTLGYFTGTRELKSVAYSHREAEETSADQ